MYSPTAKARGQQCGKLQTIFLTVSVLISHYKLLWLSHDPVLPDHRLQLKMYNINHSCAIPALECVCVCLCGVSLSL